MAKSSKDAVERLAETRAKKAREKAENSYKLPGGGTKYDTPGTKNGFNPGKGHGKKGFYS